MRCQRVPGIKSQVHLIDLLDMDFHSAVDLCVSSWWMETPMETFMNTASVSQFTDQGKIIHPQAIGIIVIVLVLH